MGCARFKIGTKSGCLQCCFPWVSLVTLVKFWNNIQSVHDGLLQHLSKFINRPNIQHYTVWATENIVVNNYKILHIYKILDIQGVKELYYAP
jgi:hypothetical protein